MRRRSPAFAPQVAETDRFFDAQRMHNACIRFARNDGPAERRSAAEIRISRNITSASTQPRRGWAKASRQAADDGEAGGFPGGDGAGVGRYDEVELHGAEAAGAGGIQRMGEQRSGDAFALRRGCGGVAGVGDMRPAAALVRTEVGGAENAAFGLGDEDLASPAGEPIVEGGVSAAVGRHAEDLARGADGCEDRPDRVVVSGFGGADQHGPSAGRRGGLGESAQAGPGRNVCTTGIVSGVALKAVAGHSIRFAARVWRSMRPAGGAGGAAARVARLRHRGGELDAVAQEARVARLGAVEFE